MNMKNLLISGIVRTLELIKALTNI